MGKECAREGEHVQFHSAAAIESFATRDGDLAGRGGVSNQVVRLHLSFDTITGAAASEGKAPDKFIQ
jgi:hypothetical protein